MTRVLLLLALDAAPLTGCVSVEMGRMGREIARDVERQPGTEVGRGFAVAFGRGTIGTSRFLTRLVAPESTRPLRQLAGHVRSVKVAHYPLSGDFDARSIGRPSALDAYEADGWYPLVTVRDADAAVWVLYRERERDQVITDLLAITLAEDDLVLTQVSGDLNALVLDAIAMGAEDGDFDSSGFFDGVFSETGLFEAPEEETDETVPPDVMP